METGVMTGIKMYDSNKPVTCIIRRIGAKKSPNLLANVISCLFMIATSFIAVEFNLEAPHIHSITSLTPQLHHD